MKAWRIYGINDIRLDDVPYPEERPGLVLLKVRMFQLSITDVQRLQGKTLIDKDQRLDWSEHNPLQRLGHEFCAEVIKLGEGVEEDIKVGDRVYYGRRSSCGECELCTGGFKDLCKNAHVIGNVTPGCLSEFFVVPANCLVRVPDTISDSATAAMQPLWAAFEMVLAAEIEKGDTVAVFGQGVMGSNCAQLSRAFGASYIIGVDIRDEALTLSRQLGVDIAINANQVDPVDVIREKTQGIGPDVVFDCASGSTEVGLSGTKTLFQSLGTVRNGGKLVTVSLLEPNAVIGYAPLINRRLQYRHSRSCTSRERSWMLHLVASKRVQIEPLVTHVLEGLDKLPQAIEITSNKSKYRAINPAQVRVAY